MKLRSKLAIKCAKGTSNLIKKLNRGSGATLPGLVARKIDPDIMSVMASMLREKSIVTMGTNGKTTTNALIYRALTDEGYKVITNATGANMFNGIVSAFVLATDKHCRLDADYACIEVDEMASVKVLPALKPDCALLTNISRDQMDRLGDVDVTLETIRSAYDSVPDTTLILNGDDAISYALSKECKNPVITYGISEQIFKDISHSEIKESTFCHFCGSKLDYDYRHYGNLGKYHCPNCDFHRPDPDYTATDITSENGTYSFRFGKHMIHSSIRTAYNIYNTLAAYAGINALGAKETKFAEAIEGFDYGNNRENIYKINGNTFQLHLAKNPVGFQQKISLILNDPDPKDIVLLVNDFPQDGEDVSWLWGIDFQYLRNANARSITVAGNRYGDFGLRFKYEDIPFKTTDDMKATVSDLIKNGTDNIYLVVNYSGLFPTNDILKALKNEAEGGAQA